MERMELRINDTVSINAETLFVEGLVNKADSWSNVLGNRKKFREKVSKGAFAKTLKEGKTIDFLYDHNKTLILSTTDNESLILWEDEEGLQMRSEVSKTTYGTDAYILIKDKIINHMSFGFKVIKERWSKGLDGIYERIIDELVLTEVSAVRNPAYYHSIIEARGIEIIEDVEIPDLEYVKNNFYNKENRGENFMINKNLETKSIEQIVGDNKGNGIMSQKGTKVTSGFTVAEKIEERLQLSQVLSKCNNKISDTNTGIAVFPIIKETEVTFTEVKAEGIEKELEISDLAFNATPNAEEVYKTQLGLMINKEIEDKISLALEKVATSNGTDPLDLFTLNPKYVGDNFIVANSTDFEKLSKIKMPIGEPYMQYILINNKLTPCINRVPVVVNENVTKVILFTPSYIGISHLTIDEIEEIITTQLKRFGKKLFRRFTGANAGVLDTKSITAITLD